jgi:hypothetical protein
MCLPQCTTLSCMWHVPVYMHAVMSCICAMEVGAGNVVAAVPSNCLCVCHVVLCDGIPVCVCVLASSCCSCMHVIEAWLHGTHAGDVSARFGTRKVKTGTVARAVCHVILEMWTQMYMAP